MPWALIRSLFEITPMASFSLLITGVDVGVGKGVSVGVAVAVEVGVSVGGMGVGTSGVTAACSWLDWDKYKTPPKPSSPRQIKPNKAMAKIMNNLFDCPPPENLLMMNPSMIY